MSVENSGFEDEIKKWAQFPKVFEEELEKEAKKLSAKWVARIREETPIGPTRQLRPSWRGKVEHGSAGLSIILFSNVKHAPYWNYPTRHKVWGKFTGRITPGTYAVEHTRREVYRELPQAIRNAMERTERRVGK